MNRFELTREYVNTLERAIQGKNEAEILEHLDKLHPADIAEILDELDVDDGLVVLQYLDGERASEVIIELEEELRKKYLSQLTSKEIAEHLIENLDSDDAADLVSELSEEKREAVIAELDDVEQASDIVSLLGFEEGTAGALMGKEMIWVNQEWTVMQAVKEMRRQAENMENVYTVYVVDNNKKLLGRLPVKKLLTTPVRTKLKDIYREDLRYVKTYTAQEEVAKIMEKYDLVVLPVVDELGRLVGRITIDDIVDVIKEEADRDYQLASGISSDVDLSDSVWNLTKARLPWLIIGLLGGIVNASIIGGYETAIATIPALAFFMPLITATAGNVGVQSSAIIVQGLANNTVDLSGIFPKLFKEFLVALVNGIVISLLALVLSYLLFGDFKLGATVCFSLLSVIILAALLGTLVPLLLDKYKIDPALATGPFITTSNDILGLSVYFIIGQLIFQTL
jgi:magnesium transporter